MNECVCAKCGGKEKINTYRFAEIKTDNSIVTTGNLRTTTSKETVTDLCSRVYCDGCLKKKKAAYAVGEFFGGVILFYLGLLFLSLFVIKKDFFNSHFPAIAAFLAVLALGCAVFLLISALTKRKSFFAAKLINRESKAPTVKYVSLDRDLYRKNKEGGVSYEDFKKKSGLNTDVAYFVFFNLVSGEISDEQFYAWANDKSKFGPAALFNFFSQKKDE